MKKDEAVREAAYTAASRAYRSVAIALRAQGVGTHASRFNTRAVLMDCYAHYHNARAQIATKRLMRGAGTALQCLGMAGTYALVWVSARISVIVMAYVLVVAVFAALFVLAGQQANANMSLGDALILSIMSFHGRGLLPSAQLTEGMRAFASVEAVLGLLIEALFVAAFTRRVTGN